MGLAKEQLLYDPPTDYEDDLDLWLREQIELLRQKRINEVDLPNLIEELEDMGRSHRKALRSSYRLLVAHLLKWSFQPERRSSSWEITIVRERQHIADEEELSPSLKADGGGTVRHVYRTAVKEASVETGLPPETFPPECPWTLEQLRDDDFLPE
jgi:hypothetical protein